MSQKTMKGEQDVSWLGAVMRGGPNHVTRITPLSK